MRRAFALALAPAALLPLAACGIQNSDVVEAGGAATVTVEPTNGMRMLLFFVGRDGRLRAVPRAFPVDFSHVGDSKGAGGVAIVPTYPTDVGYHLPVDKLLAVLLAGPDAHERAAGLTTRIELEYLEGKPAPVAQPVPDADGAPVFQVRFGTRVLGLDPLAVRQVVCTAAYGVDPGGAVRVVVSGVDGALPAARCEID